MASPGVKRKPDTLAAAVDLKKPKTDASITSFFGAPKSTSTSASKGAGIDPKAPATLPPAVKFDKAKWVSSLTPEQKELLKLEIDTLHESWLSYLRDEVLTKEFLDLKRFLKKEVDSGKKIFPPMNEVYAWSTHTPLNTVKAVIIGQDPYHNHNQAHGLCFSVRPPTPAPPSLKNMYIALKKDYPDFTPPPKNGGLLTPWADRGVLLLNTCLTVRAHEANSHSNHGWERFTQKVIDTVAKVRTRGVVFLAWGTPAQKRVAKVDKQKHCVLQSVHPSPLSAARGFFDCGHFKKTNDWLSKRYGPEGVIDWNLDKPAAPAAISAPPKTAPSVVPEPAAVTESTKEPEPELPPVKKGGEDDMDDDDAIEALAEVAASDVANGEPTSSAPEKNASQQDEDKDTKAALEEEGKEK